MQPVLHSEKFNSISLPKFFWEAMIRFKIFLYFLLAANSLSLAQQNTFNKEVELKKFVERGGKVEETSANVYRLTYTDGSQKMFDFNSSTNQDGYPEGFDTTIINVWEIDTTLYAINSNSGKK